MNTQTLQLSNLYIYICILYMISLTSALSPCAIFNIFTNIPFWNYKSRSILVVFKLISKVYLYMFFFGDTLYNISSNAFLACSRFGISQNIISPLDPTDTTNFSSGLIFTRLIVPLWPFPTATVNPSS